MNPYPLLAGAAWFRLGIAGLDVLAVVVIVRLSSVFAAWWRRQRPSRSTTAAVRTVSRRHTHI
jgi:hypothetical protein